MKIQNKTHKPVSIFNAETVLTDKELIAEGEAVIEDELGTTLADELKGFNDIPLTKAEKRELGYIAKEEKRQRADMERVIKNLLVKAGITANEYEADYRAYC